MGSWCSAAIGWTCDLFSGPLREGKLAKTTQSNADEPTNWKQVPTNQRRDAVIEIQEGYIDASELPSDVEFGDDDVPRAQQKDNEEQRQKQTDEIVDSAV